MRPDTERFLDHASTTATLLGRPGWFHCRDWYAMDRPIVLDPGQKPTPGGVADGLGEVPILHEVADLQVFVGNQIVR